MTNELLLINEMDEVIGYGEKASVHRQAQLHRAFSVFLINEDGKILIQRRACGKYHSGGLLSNSCCSHPYRHESFPESVKRCIRDELGIPAKLLTGEIREAGSFLYFADLGEMKEHEIDHVQVYQAAQEEINAIQLNPEEAEEIFWKSPSEIDGELAEDRCAYTAWFAQAWQIAKAIL